ncbi:hypothetical protein NDU88_002232 [Pleurodeles waltl]|uniref:Uncharacterized protein n=1 Tax=Pleurodeles waltl TaxID=8319 RepID=A0AAV7T295_PLEWA|nr:hypothetical protein NDU88_002232 [Pleurodeles waltl]
MENYWDDIPATMTQVLGKPVELTLRVAVLGILEDLGLSWYERILVGEPAECAADGPTRARATQTEWRPKHGGRELQPAVGPVTCGALPPRLPASTEGGEIRDEWPGPADRAVVNPCGRPWSWAPLRARGEEVTKPAGRDA